MNRRGISLVVLVITIVVMLILTVSVVLLATGQDGIISKAQDAKNNTELNTAREKINLEMSAINVDASFKRERASEFMTDNTPLEEELEEKGITYVIGSEQIVFTVDETYTVITDLDGNIQDAERTIINTAYLETPILGSGMTGIYWDGTTETNITGIDDANWYDYVAQVAGTDGESKWANAKTGDGSYWVWIPRFEYKITDRAEGAPDTAAGTIDVRFISKETTTASTGYIIHPAFRNKKSMPGQTEDYTNGEWDKELAGIWVAKYEMSGSSVATMKSVPGVESWRSINIANCYNYAYEYNTTLESHLMKNSEWGAVAYLTHSQYGRNAVAEVTRNESASFYTGGSEGATATTNLAQSSTGNATGVYDLNGGAYEHTAAYNTAYSRVGNYYGGENGTTHTSYRPATGAHFAYIANGTSSKYVTAYTNASTSYTSTEINCKVGDAIYEIGKGASTGWYSDLSYCVGASGPFFRRGGGCDIGDVAGVFSSSCHSGDASGASSFRVVLAL